jgi:TBC1 domain family member 14
MLAFFQEDGPCHKPLQHLLEAFVVLRPDLGYVQGMSFIAAVFLLNMDPYEAFVCFANVLNRRLFLSFFRMDLEQVGSHCCSRVLQCTAVAHRRFVF